VSETAERSGIRNVPYHGREVVAWIEGVRPLLRTSAWAPGLDIQGVDAIDVLRSYIFRGLTRLARDGTPESRVLHAGRRPLGARLRVIRDRLAHRITERKAMWASWTPERCPVVFWPWQQTHIKAQAPVARALRDLGVKTCFVVSRSEMCEAVRSSVGGVVFSTAAWPARVREGREGGRRLRAVFAADPGVSFPPFPVPCERRQVVAALRETFVTLLPMVGEMIAVTDAIADSMSPRVLVVGNDLTLVGRTGCIRGRRNGIRTACLVHGSIAGPLQGTQLADKILVYGSTNLRQLTDVGVPAARIDVCGAPYLDDLPRQSGQIHPRLREGLGLSDDKAFVLIATSGPGNSVSHAHHEAVIHSLMRLSGRRPDVDFVAKLHRKDKVEYYELARKSIPESRLLVVPHGGGGLPTDIFDWLHGCSVVVTGASTVAMESMLMGVPVITIDMADELHDVAFIDAAATMHVKSGEALDDALRTLLQSPERRADITARASDYLPRNYYALDGSSSQRAASAIRDLAAE
jgi:hypothetical protein